MELTATVHSLNVPRYGTEMEKESVPLLKVSPMFLDPVVHLQSNLGD